MTEHSHPLLNSLVLKNILRFSTLRDLPLHRLVCKTWFWASLSRWRSKATLNVLQCRSHEPQPEHSDSEYGEFHPPNTTAPEKTGITLGELQTLLCSNEDENLISREFLQLDSKPFMRYRLKQWTVRHEEFLKVYYSEKKKVSESEEESENSEESENERESVNEEESENEDDSDLALSLAFARPNPPIKSNLRDCTQKQLICGADAFPQFWQKLGPLMHHLYLDRVNFIFTDDPSPILLIIFHHTPTLRFLSVHVTQFKYCFISGCLEDSLRHFQIPPKPQLTELVLIGLEFPLDEKNFLALFPNLQSFKSWTSKSLFSTVSVLQNDIGNDNSIKLPLKHLTIHHQHHHMDSLSWFQHQTFDQDLREYKDINVAARLFQLETLHLGTSATFNEFVRTEFLQGLSYILKTYSSVSTLETLKIFMTPFAQPSRILRLDSTMNFVKHLELVGNAFSSLSFLPSMPNLESLRVRIGCFENRQEFSELRVETITMHRRFIKVFKHDVVANALSYGLKDYVAEQLRSLYIDYEFGNHNLKWLGRWMPHVKELQTILNRETLSVVCQQWKNLEKLELLYGSKVDDEGIVKNVEFLRKLRTFKLETYCDQSRIGNHAATEGFLKMEQLQNLMICVSKEMTPEVERELKTKIWNARIIRNYGDNEPAHVTYGECCKRLQFLYETVEGGRD